MPLSRAGFSPMTSYTDLDMLFSLAGLVDFHHFFHSLVFLLAFLRYGEEIWPEEPSLLPPCPRYCSSFSFLCLVSTISFPSTKTLAFKHLYFSFSLPSIPVKAFPWEQFFQLLHPRQMCSSWHSAPAVPVCCGTRSASAICCSRWEFPVKNQGDKVIPPPVLQTWLPLQDAEWLIWWASFCFMFQ